MAVRHGYGKIAGTDALVFAYDTGDTRNSYKGEPTTNILSTYVNPTFENGSTSGDGWAFDAKTNGSRTYHSADSYSGTYSIKITNSTVSSIAFWRADIPVVSGVQYTISVYAKNIDCPTTPYFSGVNISGGSETFTGISTTEWKRFTKTYTASSTGNAQFYIRTNANATQGSFLIDNFQIEQKSHATPFVNGTRSITQGLLDLTGNNSISLNSSTFDSNAQIDLDGTSTSIYPGTISAASGLSEVTFETVVRSNANNKNILLTAGNAILLHYGGAGFYLVSSDGTASGYLGWNSEIAGGTGVYEHLAATWDGSTMKLYVNGQKTTYDRSFSGGTSGVLKPFNNTTLGGYFNSTQPNFNGNIDVAKIYNRALTAQEIRNNYNQYKGRFGI